MRAHFKYANGYVNVDDDHIYLTSSGNWAETKKLKEKGVRSIKENRRRIDRISFFVYLVIASLFLIWLYADHDNKLLLVMLPIVGYNVYRYFKPDLGKRYKIPVAKIQSVEPVSGGFEIQFTNLDGELDSERITRVQADGARVLNEIKLKIFPLNEYLSPPEAGIE